MDEYEQSSVAESGMAVDSRAPQSDGSEFFTPGNVIGLVTVMMLFATWELGRRQFNKTQKLTKALSKELREHEIDLKISDRMIDSATELIQESVELRHQYFKYLGELARGEYGESEQEDMEDEVFQCITKVSQMARKLEFFSETKMQGRLLDNVILFIYNCRKVKGAAEAQLVLSELFDMFSWQFFVIEEIAPKIYMPKYIKQISEDYPGDAQVEEVVELFDTNNKLIKQALDRI